MPKQRTHSNDEKYIINETKITRRLDAITKYKTNYVESGCDIITVGSYQSVAINAGVIIMNNTRKVVPSISAVGVGTYITNRFATIYIPSVAGYTANATVAVVASSSTAYCPDVTIQGTATTSVVPEEVMLIGHIYRTSSAMGTVIDSSGINNNVKPRLYFDTMAWQKDDNTDTDTTVIFP
jgi:hypothetical protein